MENKLVLNEDVEDSRETIEILHSISELMGCDLDKETIAILISLIQMGVNPEVLAHAVKELRRDQLSPGSSSTL